MTTHERAKLIWESLATAMGGYSQITNLAVIQAVYGQMNNNWLPISEVAEVLGYIANLDTETFNLTSEEEAKNKAKLVEEFTEYCQYERLTQEAAQEEE